ncbi:Ku protein [Bailinhaonella thermotolerans]|uniref:Non-homologous end joining protein Ku n=1 Tax=Bailinhaonella thermotolerans TaxID=1070861 RepID=A0A3A4BG74_9ACTN|nr:Ku protein [Bailinhaonella thermotolerans]RJL33492.1 Ku protein [Bailinhaonella thermotolerans]
MRSIWKGAISFGLVTIPVKLYSATEQKDVTFHQVHREDGGRIKYRRVCTIDGEEVPYSDIAKGYELATGEMVVLTDEDFEDLPLTSSRRIDVLQFSPLEQVDPIYFQKAYYLEPDGPGTKPYVLLRDALERSGKVAIVKIAIRQRESLATLRVRDGVFVVETMLWPDEVREAEFGFLDEDIDVRAQELTMAESLIDTMSGDFDPTEYHDTYREALQQVIEAKVAGKEIVQPEQPEEAGPAVDLMAALRASVEAAKKGRAPAEKRPASGRRTVADASARSDVKKPAAEKKAAEKAAAGKAEKAEKKGAAKKAADKKTAEKKPAEKKPAAKKAADKRPAEKKTAERRKKAS